MACTCKKKNYIYTYNVTDIQIKRKKKARREKFTEVFNYRSIALESTDCMKRF